MEIAQYYYWRDPISIKSTSQDNITYRFKNRTI
jgi:hypothetical protein